MLNIELYKMTQFELQMEIVNTLKRLGINYDTDVMGNIYGINHPDKPLFIAHTDIIQPESVYEPLVIKDGMLSREGKYTLGADDRAGINIMLNHIKDINFAFFVDEETGCEGSTFAAESYEFDYLLRDVTFIVALDRKGRDVLGHEHGYCTKELQDMIVKATGAKPSIGSYCDLDSFIESVQGVNLGVGYHHQHTAHEFLNIAEWNEVNDSIPKINNIKIKKEVYLDPYFYKLYDKKELEYNIF